MATEETQLLDLRPLRTPDALDDAWVNRIMRTLRLERRVRLRLDPHGQRELTAKLFRLWAPILHQVDGTTYELRWPGVAED
jgi:hypothetical protein